MASFDFSGIGEALDSLSTKLTDGIIRQAAGYSENLLSAASAFFAAATVLYFVYQAIQIIYSSKEHDPMLFLKDILVLSTLSAFTYGGSLYTQDVAQFVMNVGDDLASAAIGTDSRSALTGMLNKSLVSIMAAYEKISFSWTAIPTFIMSVIVYLCAIAGVIVFVSECFFYLVIAKFMSGLCVSVGGLFICALAFPPTRNLFTSWVSMCLNYILLTLLMSLGLALIVTVITDNVGEMGTFSQCVIALITLLIAAKMVGQIPALAGGLSSGVQFSPLKGGDFMSKANPGIRAMANAGKAGMMVGKGIGAAGAGIMKSIKGGIGKA